MSDFFAVGHGKFAPVNSLAVLVKARSAMNCFWSMPFRKHAKITLTNEARANVGLLTYQITFAETAGPENAAYLHAQYRRASAAQQNPYVILDGAKGRGQYVGSFLAWSQMSDGCFGEGEINFYLDGDPLPRRRRIVSARSRDLPGRLAHRINRGRRPGDHVLLVRYDQRATRPEQLRQSQRPPAEPAEPEVADTIGSFADSHSCERCFNLSNP